MNTTLVDIALSKFGIEFVVAAIKRWQNLTYIHPLTCGNNSNHSPLIAKTDGVNVWLECPDCDYVQKHIPDAVITSLLTDCSDWLTMLHAISDHG